MAFNDVKENVISLGSIYLKLNDGDQSVIKEINDITNKENQAAVIHILERYTLDKKNLAFISSVAETCTIPGIEYIKQLLKVPDYPGATGKELETFFKGVIEMGRRIESIPYRLYFLRVCIQLAIKADRNEDVRGLLKEIEVLEENNSGE